MVLQRYTPYVIAGFRKTIYVPALTIPAPTGATTVVSTAAAFNTAYQAASAGDMIVMANGTYDAATALPNGWNKAGVIVMAQNFGSYDVDPMGGGNGPHFARFQRMVNLVFAANAWNTNCYKVTATVGGIIGIHFQIDTGLWPADNASWRTTLGAPTAVGWPFIDVQAAAGDPKLFYNEFSVGYGNSCDPIDPTLKYSDANSPATFTVSSTSDGYTMAAGGALTGWGDGSYFTYNRLINGPYPFRKESPSSMTSLTIYGNYVHDCSRGFVGCTSNTGVTQIQHNWMERIYQDFLTVSASGSDLPSRMLMQQNVCLDPTGSPQDSCNPHSDTNQVYISAPSPNPRYWRGIESNRNVFYAHQNCRGYAQVNFFQLSAFHYNTSTEVVYGQGMKIRDNWSSMSGSSIGGNTGVSSVYVRNNQMFHPIGQINTALTTGMIIDAVSGTYGTGFPAAKSAYLNNIFESQVGTTGLVAQLVKTNNAAIGNRTARSISDATIFSGNFSTYPATPGDMFNASKRTPTYASMGPQYNNIADLLLGTIDWTNEVPFVSWTNVAAATAATLTTSGLSEVYGGDLGDSLTISPGAGIEWQSYLLDGTTVVIPWTTSNGSVLVGQQLLRVRATSPSAGNAQSFNVTIGGSTYSWAIVTAATAIFPRATLDGTVAVAQNANGAMSTDGKTGFMYLQFALDPAHATSKAIVTLVSGVTDINVTVQSSKKIKITGKDPAGTTTAFSFNGSIVLTTAGTIRMWVQIDTSQSTLAGAVTVFVDNGTGTAVQDAPFAGSTYIQDTLLGYSRSIKREVGPTLVGSFDCYWYETNVILDPSDVVVQASFNRNNIGTNGNGPTGSQPKIFLVGYDALLNATGTTTSTDANLGSLVMIKQAGTWVTTNGQIWP